MSNRVKSQPSLAFGGELTFRIMKPNVQKQNLKIAQEPGMRSNRYYKVKDTASPPPGTNTAMSTGVPEILACYLHLLLGDTCVSGWAAMTASPQNHP